MAIEAKELRQQIEQSAIHQNLGLDAINQAAINHGIRDFAHLELLHRLLIFRSSLGLMMENSDFEKHSRAVCELMGEYPMSFTETGKVRMTFANLVMTWIYNSSKESVLQ